MTKDDIIRMANEVGIKFDPNWGTCYTGNTQLCEFANLVAAAEREACAVIAFNAKTYLEAAEAIRARGQG